MWRPERDAYLAGLADGEATFLLNTRRERPAINPRFTINLRADDAEILLTLQRTFGGRITFSRSPSRPVAQCYWHVVRKADLLGLVRYFDQFPLRAKKRHDYALWREAVILYAARGGGAAFAELSVLRDALIAGRVYGSDEGEAVPESPQLRLVGRG